MAKVRMARQEKACAASRQVLALDPGSPSTEFILGPAEGRTRGLRSVPGVRERVVEMAALPSTAARFAQVSLASLQTALSRAGAAKRNLTRDLAQQLAAKRRNIWRVEEEFCASQLCRAGPRIAFRFAAGVRGRGRERRCEAAEPQRAPLRGCFIAWLSSGAPACPRPATFPLRPD